MTSYGRNRMHAAALIAVAMIALGPIAFAQDGRSGGGNDEGVSVHGHWLVVVRNADGSVAERREFDNALIPTTTSVVGGTSAMAGLLTGQYFSTSWGFTLGPSAAQLTSGPCGIAPCSGLFSSVTLPTVPDENGSPTPSGTFALSGQIQANQDSSIGWVATTLNAQQGMSFRFSGREISPAIQVRSGQVVQLAVTYSFS